MAEESRRGNKICARDVFEAYFLKHHLEDLKNILEMEDEELHYSVYIKLLRIFDNFVGHGGNLETSPLLKMIFQKEFLPRSKQALSHIDYENLGSLKRHLGLISLSNFTEKSWISNFKNLAAGRPMSVLSSEARTNTIGYTEYIGQNMAVCVYVMSGIIQMFIVPSQMSGM
ncbi:unnamed protein product, partial [Meganyctiphanes norvegica]